MFTKAPYQCGPRCSRKSGFSERHAEEIDLTGKKAEEVEVLLNIIYMHSYETTEAEDVSGIVWYIPASC